MKPILAAVDGSEPALRAVEWAAREAAAAGTSLRLVHVVHPVVSAGTGMVPAAVPVPVGVLEETGQQTLADAVDAASGVLSRDQVAEVLVHGPVARTLIDMSGDAALLALGTEGAGPVTRLLIGSVTGHVAAHSRCPVVVTPAKPRQDGSGTAVVGIDGSDESVAALRFAMSYADRHGTDVTAVCAVQLNPIAQAPELADIGAPFKRQAERFLAEAVAGCAEDYPAVRVNRTVRTGHPVDVLLTESAQGNLLVVGSRGRGAFTGMILGSVSQAVLRHAKVAVVVVHPEGGR